MSRPDITGNPKKVGERKCDGAMMGGKGVPSGEKKSDLWWNSQGGG